MSKYKEDPIIDSLEVDDAGAPVYLHNRACPGYCDYACNTPQGDQVAEVLHKSRKAIRHLLSRIRDHEHIGYYLGPVTESWELLIDAAEVLFKAPKEQIESNFTPRNSVNPKITAIEKIEKEFRAYHPLDGEIVPMRWISEKLQELKR